jgi:hypothetical protein
MTMYNSLYDQVTETFVCSEIGCSASIATFVMCLKPITWFSIIPIHFSSIVPFS